MQTDSLISGIRPCFKMLLIGNVCLIGTGARGKWRAVILILNTYQRGWHPIHLSLKSNLMGMYSNTGEQQDGDMGCQCRFPFMKLPPEIRNKIYKIVISPMCIETTNGFYGVQIGLYWPERKPNKYNDFLPPCPGETNSDQRERLRHRDPNFSTPRKAHPGRNYNYDLQTFFETVYEDLDDILSLSNTSSIIRKELSGVTFARTSLSFSPSTAKFVEQLLMDRPAIWSGIKRISISVSFMDAFAPSSRILGSLKLISTLLQVEFLAVRYIIHEEEIDSFLDDEDNESASVVEAMRYKLGTHTYTHSSHMKKHHLLRYSSSFNCSIPPLLNYQNNFPLFIFFPFLPSMHIYIHACSLQEKENPPSITSKYAGSFPPDSRFQSPINQSINPKARIPKNGWMDWLIN